MGRYRNKRVVVTAATTKRILLGMTDDLLRVE
jgi:hypothetical protein